MKKFFAWFMVLAFAICCFAPVTKVRAQKESTKSGINQNIVKVRLVTLGSDIRILSAFANGDFRIKENNKAIANTGFVVKYASEKVTLYGGNDEILYSGTEINIARSNPLPEGGYIEINGRKDLGDFRFRCAENSDEEKYLQVINHVPMAYYLYGVVSGEMSESYPSEALKAQSIVAKNYVISSMREGSNYDVGDTSATQVYKGYDPSLTNIITSVNSVIDEVVTYDNKLIKTYYAASNGGETDIPTNAWSGSDSSLNKGYAISIDDYDFNSTGAKETLVIKLGESVENEQLSELLTEYAKQQNEQAKSIVKINSCMTKDPKREGTTRNHANASFDITVKLTSGETENMTVEFSVDEFINKGIFEKEYLRTYWGQKTDANTYEIYHVRHGHGVGLSQRAARYRASCGQSYRDIIAFYYPGTTLSHTDLAVPGGDNDSNFNIDTDSANADMLVNDSKENEGHSDSMAQIEKNPRKVSDIINDNPNFIFDDDDIIQISTFAYVTQTGAALKSSPDGIIIDRLSYGEMLTVLEEGDNYYKVETEDRMTGYVSTQFIQTIAKEPTVTATYKLAYINSDSTNFREKPNTSCNVICKLGLNDTLYLWKKAGSDNDWYYAQSGMKYGYVYSQYVNVVGTYTAFAVADGGVIASGITTDTVNLRPEPSTSNDPIMKLDSDMNVLIYGYENGWYNVSADGIIGYLSERYVKVTSALPIAPDGIGAPMMPDAIGIGVINASDVRFRSQPDTSSSSNIITLLQRGDELTLYLQKDGWFYAEFDGQMGYVASQYVDARLYAGDIIDEAPVTLAEGITTASVNFRSKANTSSTVYETLERGTKLIVIGKCKDEWYFVYCNGRYGFVSKKYARIEKEGNTDIISVAEDWTSYMAKTEAEVNFRRGPGIEYGIIKKIAKNTSVRVLAITMEWCLISYNGEYGYAYAPYIV